MRYADDIVLGFQVKSEAERFWAELAERLRKFHLELHPDKTRLLEFGPYAAERRRTRGRSDGETSADHKQFRDRDVLVDAPTSRDPARRPRPACDQPNYSVMSVLFVAVITEPSPCVSV